MNRYHTIIKIDQGFIFYVCGQAPKMELRTPGVPKKCSVCACPNPTPLDGRTEGHDVTFENV